MVKTMTTKIKRFDDITIQLYDKQYRDALYQFESGVHSFVIH